VKALSILHFVRPLIINFFKRHTKPRTTSKILPLIMLARAIFLICNVHGFLLLLPCIALLFATPVGIPVCQTMVVVTCGRTSIAVVRLCILLKPRLTTFVAPVAVVMLMMMHPSPLQLMIHVSATTGPDLISMEYWAPSPFETLVPSNLGVLLVLTMGPFAVFPSARQSAPWIAKSSVTLFSRSFSTSSHKRHSNTGTLGGLRKKATPSSSSLAGMVSKPISARHTSFGLPHFSSVSLLVSPWVIGSMTCPTTSKCTP
jgi:hypothetical protein